MTRWWQYILALVIWSTLSVAQANVLKAINYRTLANHSFEVQLDLQSPLQAPPRAFFTNDPSQLVVDLPGVKPDLKNSIIHLNHPICSRIRIIPAKERTRLVLSTHDPVHYSVKRHAHGIWVTLEPPHAPTTTKELDTAGAFGNHIQFLDFQRKKDGGGRLVFKMSALHPHINLRKSGQNIHIDFFETLLPATLRHRLDVSDFSTPVSVVDVNQHQRQAQVLMQVSGRFNSMAYQVDHQFIVDVTPIQENSQESKADPTYHGERVSFNFQNIAIRQVLQLLADFTHMNLVASDNVHGNVTLRLSNVPWDQALDIVLSTHGLAKRVIGNVMLVAPANEIAQRERQELAAQNQIQALAPLHSELIQVNYGSAASLVSLVQSDGTNLLSDRGHISVDERTNKLWVQDTSDKIAEIKRVIKELDVPVQQVLIEARIVNVDKNFSRELGIQFGVTQPKTPMTGTLAGANDIADGTTLSEIATARRMNVAMPISGDSVSHIGLALANLGHGVLLDMELSALESEGRGRIISSPRVITANQHTALIESGEEIPYEQQTSSGATNVAFKKAVLALEVTPQITPDNKVILNLSVNQDKRSSKPEVKGVPAIDTEAVQTQVLVNNGSTIVLGGIFKSTKTRQVNRVPFFGALPIVGNLFKKTQNINNETELLIFITPRIIHNNESHQ